VWVATCSDWRSRGSRRGISRGVSRRTCWPWSRKTCCRKTCWPWSRKTCCRRGGGRRDRLTEDGQANLEWSIPCSIILGYGDVHGFNGDVAGKPPKQKLTSATAFSVCSTEYLTTIYVKKSHRNWQSVLQSNKSQRLSRIVKVSTEGCLDQYAESTYHPHPSHNPTCSQHRQARN